MLNKIPAIGFKASAPSGSVTTAAPDKNNKPVLDGIVQASIKINDDQKKPPSFLAKIFQYPTLSIIPQLPITIGVVYQGCKMIFSKEKMKKEITAMGKEKFINSMIKKAVILYALAVPIYFITDFFNKKKEIKGLNESNQLVDTFNKQNKAGVRLSQPLKMSPIIGAMADPITGKIVMNRVISKDMLMSSLFQKPYMKHELVHMNQYILMGCSQNGIQKLNFIAVKNLSREIDDAGKKEIYDAYQEIQSGIDDKYRNTSIERFGDKLNLVDYITAMYKVIYEKEKTTPNDLPIIINKEFYENAKAQRGPLTPEEEKKAQVYLDAYEKYPTIGISQAINPNSEYKQNILEKEAFAATPWYAR